MIPIKLSLRNFMCYRSDGAVLDLTGIHLACLSGENGSGKSALLGAITWALWGKARERVSDDELMSQGASEMEVEYDFALGEANYRVIRKRSRKGSSGSTILELHVRTDSGGFVSADRIDGDASTEDSANSALSTQNSELGTWRPITGHNVRDTQATITDLLKMEYDTFINSAFILQGRADEFTVKSPTDRKKVLADILGLEEYDRLEDRAKEEAKERKAAMTNLEGQMANIDKELLRRPDYAQDLEGVESELIERQEERDTAKEALGALQARSQELQSNLRRLEEVRARVAHRKSDMDSAQVSVYTNTAHRTELEALLAQREDIERGYASLRDVQKQEQRLIENMSRLHELEREQSRYDQIISNAKTQVESETRNSERKISEFERNQAGRGILERQLADAMEKVRKLDLVQVQHEDTRCLRDNLDTRIHTLIEQMGTLEKEGKQLGEKLGMIMAAHADGKGHANCPLCDTALSADALARVQHTYQEDIDAKRQEYDRKRKEQKTTHDDLVAAIARLADENDQLKSLPVHVKHRAEYEQRLLILDKEQEKLEKEQSQLNLLKTQMANEDFAHEARQTLLDVKARMATVGYSKEEHEASRRKVQELQPYNERYHKLESADSKLALVLGSLEADSKRLATWEKEQGGDKAEVAVLEPQENLLGEVKALLTEKQAEVAELEKAVTTLVDKRGDLRGRLDHCDALQAEKSQLMARYKVAVEEKGIYDELTTAFGKKGIQAMIIENIIPELEDEANVLLHRMTDGRMSVHFATQRDARSSKAVIETLDINISDEIGTRSYELYSGGEAFRVNFAVRIALSKLLARRAGAQLQLLVIDEGFGTQDGQGRDKLVSAINSIQEDFEKILVVTHIEELKGEFPVRIDVVKTETGSYITMS